MAGAVRKRVKRGSGLTAGKRRQRQLYIFDRPGIASVQKRTAISDDSPMLASGRLHFGGLLAKREQIRLSALEIFVSAEIQRRLNEGDQPRADALFEEYIPKRSDADEITESIFRIAQRDPEERKLPYIAKLLASIVFNPQIDAKLGHHLTSLANSSCGSAKPLTEYFRSRRSADGLNRRCKSCCAESRRRPYLKSRQRILAYQRDYYAEHKAKTAAVKKAYRTKHRARLSQ